MSIKRLAISTIATTTTMVLFAGLLHNAVFAKFYLAQSGGVHEANFAAPLGYLVLGLMMSLIFPVVFKGKNPIMEGMAFGATIGVLWVFPHELVVAGIHGDPLGYVFGNALVHVGEQGLGGVVLGYTFGRYSKMPN